MARTPYGEANLPQPGVWHFDKDSGAGWAVGAQSHYSFFENLERGLLKKYHFGNARDGTLNNWYSHFSINMMAIRGSHVALKVCQLVRYVGCTYTNHSEAILG